MILYLHHKAGGNRVNTAKNKMTTSAITAAQVQLSPDKNNFSLYYTRHPFDGGLNLERARSGFSIWNFVLNSKDVADLEKWFALNGIVGEYKYTKAANWVRCQNRLSTEQLIELTYWLKANTKTIAFFVKK